MTRETTSFVHVTYIRATAGKVFAKPNEAELAA